jgi:hypothetical protein
VNSTPPPGTLTGMSDEQAVIELQRLGYAPDLARRAVEKAGVPGQGHQYVLGHIRVSSRAGGYQIESLSGTPLAPLTGPPPLPPESRLGIPLTRDDAVDELVALGYDRADCAEPAIDKAPDAGDGMFMLSRHIVQWNGQDAWVVTGYPPEPWPELVRDYDVAEILAAIRIVDAHLDAAAPQVYRQDPAASAELNEARALANHYRRISAGPSSEAQEAVDALNLATGGNPRKGVIGDEDTILGELGDGVVANLLAIQSFTKDTDRTWAVFMAALAKALARVPGDRP